MRRDLERPNRLENYIIQLTAEVRRLIYLTARKDKSINFEEFRLKYDYKQPEQVDEFDFTDEELEEIEQEVEPEEKKVKEPEIDIAAETLKAKMMILPLLGLKVS